MLTSVTRVACTTVLVLTCIVGAAPAQDDLRISGLLFEPPQPYDGYPLGGAPIPVTVTVVTEKATSLPLPGDEIAVSLRVNDIEVASFLRGNAAGVVQFQTVVPLAEFDTITAVIDPFEVYPEIWEGNNGLGFSIGPGAQKCNDSYPQTITFSDPEWNDIGPPPPLEMVCTGHCRARQSSIFPEALLIVPPYESVETNTSSSVESAYTQTSSYTQTNEFSTGLTASIGIEVEAPPIDVGVSVTWGVEIETSVSNSTGRDTGFSVSDRFNSAGPVGGSSGVGNVVVLTETMYDVCEYVITKAHDSSRIGKKVWVSTPRSHIQGVPATSLYAVRFADYNAVRSPGALDLFETPHVTGSKAGAPFDRHGWMHIAGTFDPACGDICTIGGVNNCVFEEMLVEEGRRISTAPHSWQGVLSSGTFQSSSVEVGVNYSVSGEVGGVSVETSFGASAGFSHTVYVGYDSGFEWSHPGVISIANDYFLTGYASMLTTYCRPGKTDTALILVDGYLPIATDAPPAAADRRLHIRGVYPNPFNPTTAILFETRERGSVEVTIHDSKGAQIRRWAGLRYESGPHSLTWDGRDDGGRRVASGVYFVRISGLGETTSAKLALLK